MTVDSSQSTQNSSLALEELCDSLRTLTVDLSTVDYPVTAPVDADDTIRAYFAITPV